VALVALTTAVNASAKVGFSGIDKCTFNANSAATFGAPSMALTAAKFTAFNFQWAEWESGALTARTQLLGGDLTPLFGGTIGTGEWPNPIMTWETAGVAGLATLVNGLALQPLTDFEPAMNGYVATPGKVMYWPSELGFNKLTATATMDILELSS
jgi:hypothetical protein